jgi:hypothetical protein
MRPHQITDVRVQTPRAAAEGPAPGVADASWPDGTTQLILTPSYFQSSDGRMRLLSFKPAHISASQSGYTGVHFCVANRPTSLLRKVVTPVFTFAFKPALWRLEPGEQKITAVELNIIHNCRCTFSGINAILRT